MALLLFFFSSSNLGSLINAGGILFGACMGPMFAFSLISILCPMVNLKGVTVGLLTGQLINLWLSIGSAVYRPPAPMLELTTDNCTGIFEDIPVVAPSSSVLSEEAEDDSLASFDLMSIYNMSYNIYPIIGFFFTFVVGILASLCFGGGKDLNVQDEDYFVPWAWRLYNRFYPVHRCKAKVDSQSAGNEEVLLTEMNGIL